MKQGSMVKRTLAALLCAVLMLSFVPGNLFTAYAAEADSTLWKQVGEIDKTTGGKWQKAGYGDKLAVFFGAAEKAVTEVNEKIAAGSGDGGYFRGNDYHLYIVDGVPATYNANVHPKMVDTWSGYPGRMTVYVNDMLLEAPAGYTGNWPTFNGKIRPHVNKDYDKEGFPNYVNTVPIPAALTNPTHRSFIKCNGLDTTKEYLVTLYADSVGYSGEYAGNLCFSFTTTGGGSLLSQTVVTASEFGKNGGYISFRVKGAFDLVIDQEKSRDFGLSAVFFDEYVAPETLPEKVLPEALTDADLWKQIGEVDTTTGGAWQSMGGYGKDYAVLLGYSETAIYAEENGTASAGNNVSRDYVNDLVLVDGAVVEMNKDNKNACLSKYNHHGHYPGNYKTYEITPVLELPAGYEGAMPTYSTYQSGGYVEANHTGVSSLFTTAGTTLPGSANITKARRYMHVCGGLDSSKQYIFTLYTDSRRMAGEHQGQVRLAFLSADAKTIYQDNMVDAAQFGKNGGYISFLVQGAFSLVIEFAEATPFGVSAFFFDEYVAPAAPVTPEAPVTYENWAQVGEIDTTTGGKWQTKGYGDEQAMLIGYASNQYQQEYKDAYDAAVAAAGEGAAITSVTATINGRTGTYTAYARAGATCRGNVYHTNTGANAIYMPTNNGTANGKTNYPLADSRLAYEFWHSIGSDADGNITAVPALETPAGYTVTDVLVKNTYTVPGRAANYTDSNTGTKTTEETAATFFFKTNPFSSDMGKRTIMTFTIPEAKRTSDYYFSVYINTLNINQNVDFEMSFVGLDGTLLDTDENGAVVKHRYNSADFGKGGGYVTFKVPAGTDGFFLCWDRPNNGTAGYFGVSAFFFNTQPVKAAPTHDDYEMVGLDTTTGGEWIDKYGNVQAAVALWKQPKYINDTLVVHGKTNNGSWADGRWGPGPSGQVWHRVSSGDYIRMDDGSVTQIANRRLGGEFHAYFGYDAAGNRTNVSALEVPNVNPFNTANTDANSLYGYVPAYNGYTVAGRAPGFVEARYECTATAEATAETFFFNKNPLSSGMATRTIATFTVPASLAGGDYYFTVYANTLNRTDAKDGKIEFSFVDAKGNPVGERVATTASAFGKAGAYMTFKVPGDSFFLCIDKSTDASFFGVSAFFFDKYVVTGAMDKVESASITLDGTIGVNYGVNLNMIAKEDAGAKMVLSQTGKDNVIINVADAISKNQLNWFSKGVAAKEMADIVTAQMHYSDGSKGEANEYSVVKYANTVLNTTTVDAKTTELLVRMLNYGAYAQKYFKYNTANMANSALTREAKASGLATVSTEHLQKYLANCNNGTGDIKMSYASLLLKSETTLRLSFLTKDIENTVAAVSGTDTVLPWVTRSGTSRSYVDITDIAAAELDETFKIDIIDLDTAEVVSTVSYCPLAYVYSAMTQSDDADLINAVKSLYLYNQAANAYFK